MSFSAGSRVGSRTSLHVKFDKYLELSIKSGERIRRAGRVLGRLLADVGRVCAIE